jgi:pilus assembly protein CpaF
VDARLPDGSRLHVVIPEITAEHWAINIRKHLLRQKSLSDLVGMDVMSEEVGHDLSHAVKKGLNILVSGGTQAGKTTLLGALVNEVPLHQRVITIEEVFELQPKIPDLIQMQTRGANLQGDGAISLRKLIKEALRMRPTRIIGSLTCIELRVARNGHPACKLCARCDYKIADITASCWRKHFT